MARAWVWEVDDRTTVTADLGAFGSATIRVNDGAPQKERSGLGMKKVPLTLPAGRSAEFSFGSPGGFGVACELRVAGELLLPVSAPRGVQTVLTACPHCAKPIGRRDSFCEACGKALPTQEQLALSKEVQAGNSAIGAVSVLFALAGVVMYFVQRAASNKALEQIAGFGADEPLTEPIPGVASTIGELRAELAWEPWSVALVNFVLAVIMAGLWQWGKSKPTPAIMVAFCTYVVVQVVNAALEPATIGHGIIVKIIVIAALVKGLKAALALRAVTKRA